MMVFRVTGVHRETGDPMTRVYEVETERDAVAKAYAEDMAVDEVKRMRDPKVVPNKEEIRAAREAQGESAREKISDFQRTRLERRRQKLRDEVGDYQPVLLVLNTDSVLRLAFAIGMGIAFATVFTLILWFGIAMFLGGLADVVMPVRST